jgi:hypothetical protein
MVVAAPEQIVDKVGVTAKDELIEPATVTVEVATNGTGVQTPLVANTLNVVVVFRTPVDRLMVDPFPATGIPMGVIPFLSW